MKPLDQMEVWLERFFLVEDRDFEQLIRVRHPILLIEERTSPKGFEAFREAIFLICLRNVVLGLDFTEEIFCPS